MLSDPKLGFYDFVKADLFLLMYDGEAPPDLKPESSPHPIARVRLQVTQWDKDRGRVDLRPANEIRTIAAGRLNFWRILMMRRGFVVQGDFEADIQIFGSRTVAPRELVTIPAISVTAGRWKNDK